MKHFLHSLRRDQNGATAVEFALCSTAFFAMMFGGIYASLAGFTSASLQSAVESAARCSAMGNSPCTSASGTQTYAASKFHNVTGNTPVFVSAAAACGNNVTGQVTYNLKWILGHSAFTVRAASCFPTQPASTS